ncbi:hypothetical protein CYR40_10375 [Chimaeribacter arupi]|uniref:hypothetical protein n=1 Tax=Chimaeribacter arupi TaxID=2060066 RepID=UPI000C7DBFD1|nr:hypothetical protein [Chimaeribacter arupi]PLR46661.1 hypothetical protein CYR40_10375 [Chimaeribacter arupi]
MIRYTAAHIRHWSTFSGDDNPVHYDAGFARRLGLTQTPIQGMRALLDVKAALSTPAGERNDPPQAWHFTSRLRAPIYCCQPYQLSVEQTARGVSARLLDAQAQPCISACLAGSTPPVLQPGLAVRQCDLGDTAVLPPGLPAWVALDALLFRELLASPEVMQTVHDILPELQATTLPDVMPQLPLMQTHNEASFSAALLDTPAGAAGGAAVDYAVLPALVLGDRQRGFILRLGIQASLGTQAMTHFISLKTWPAPFQHQGDYDD